MATSSVFRAKEMDMNKDELLAEANRWLATALRLESEGKPEGLINKALDKAIEFERKAFPAS